ncbi:MAG: sigma-70 family RNA polymerase sigma factor [Rikenellaceae bacterium]|jgi:RNA polymerase sigma-70 factor (ECF subfamily)|nr:sigma-70 family RNA polymerase sigma factor [Rikenellaceae bacterium]
MAIEDYIVADDAQLVDWVLAGDNSAFEYLFNRYAESIRRLYLQRVGNVSDVDDLLQETFIKVFINLTRYDRTYTFGQWLYTIARNTFIDFVRKRHEDLSIDALPPHSTVTPASTVPTPEESVISLQQRVRIEHHLDRMTPRYRELIEFRYFREFSYEEIAEKLSLPLGTVKTQIHRAREQLCRFIIEDKM